MLQRKNTVVAALLYVAGLSVCASGDVIPASAYIQNGLVAQWDGIDNAGTGVHDPNATTWVNLAGGASDAVLTNGTMTVISNAYSFTQGRMLATGLACARNTSSITLEASVKANSAPRTAYDLPFIFVNGRGFVGYDARANNGYSYSQPNKSNWGSHALIYKWWGNFNFADRAYVRHSVSAVSTVSADTGGSVGKVYEDARQQALNSSWTSATQNAPDGGVYIGNTGVDYEINSVRIYDRALTADEVVFNANIDKARFEGADPAGLTWPDGCRWNTETGKVEVRVSVGCPESAGTVAIDGGTAGTSAQKWVDVGATVSISLSCAEGYSLKKWRGNKTPEAGGESGVYTVVADVPLTLVASIGTGLRTWTGTGDGADWFDAANWSPEGVPQSGEAVEIGDGAAVALTNRTEVLSDFVLIGAGTKLTMREPVRCAPTDMVTELRAKQVQILGGAVLTHAKEDMTIAEMKTVGAWQMDGRVNVSCATFTLDQASKVSGEALGYYYHGSTYTVGPANVDGANIGIVGAHGAPSAGPSLSTWSATKGFTLRGEAYGDPRAPVWAGSSAGGGDNASIVCAGGGAIRIAATGLVTINGTVIADAQTYAGSSRRGAAGGSVWISCAAITGCGRISADGTINNQSQNTSGGSGGRVAIVYDKAAQRAQGVPAGLRISCNSKSTATKFSSGLPGTVYLPDTQFLGESFSTAGGVESGHLVIDDWSGWNPSSLTLTGARIHLPSEVCTNMALSSLTVSGFAAQLIIGGDGGTMVARSAYTHVSDKMPHLTVTGDVNLQNGGKLRIIPAVTNGVDAADWATLDVNGDISLSADSELSLYGHSFNGACCRVYANNMAVAKGATVTADGQGFSGGTNGVSMRAFGPGASKTAGAGHGGHGSIGGSIAWGRTYGSCSAPVLPGSGGGVGDSSQNGSRGGGVVWLTLTGDLVLNGTLTANGQAQLGASSGTGSGGSVYVTCRTLQGTTGKITANGGSGQVSQPGKCGAGGRIAVVYDTAAQAALDAQPTIAFSASSYAPTVNYAVNQGFGSLYLPDARFVPEAFNAANIAHVSLHCGDWSLWQPRNLSVTNAYVRLVGCPSLDVGSISVWKDGRLDIGGDSEWHHYSGGRNVYQAARGIDVAVRGDVTIGDGGQIRLYGGTTNGNAGVVGKDVDAVLSGRFDVRGDILIAANGKLHPYSNPMEGGSYRITCRKAVVASGGAINANNRGWSGLGDPSSNFRAEVGKDPNGSDGFGPGAGRASGGGGYGGMGGGGNGGRTYGSRRQPALPGSGGGKGYYVNSSFVGAGGGLVWLDARKEIVLGGSITAEGEGGGGTYCSGGSGGGIFLLTPELKVGDGSKISAQGGGCNVADGSRGGGGRIAIWANNYAEVAAATNTGVLAVSVLPGQTGNKSYGKDGTVYMRQYTGGLKVIVR